MENAPKVNHLDFQPHNFLEYPDGFSFTVSTELEAYKAAYTYNCFRVRVSYAPNVREWSVQVYKK